MGSNGWTVERVMAEPVPVRKSLPVLAAFLLALGLATPAYADQAAVDSARAAYKSAVAAAVKAHKAAITAAENEYKRALRTPADPVAVANAQAKALADQATKASQAKSSLEAEIAAANEDRKARAKAIRDYDADLRKIQLETEKALREARAFGNPKTAKEQAKVMRDKAFKTAQENLKKAKAEALAKLNAVLVANGFPAEKG